MLDVLAYEKSVTSFWNANGIWAVVERMRHLTAHHVGGRIRYDELKPLYISPD